MVSIFNVSSNLFGFKSFNTLSFVQIGLSYFGENSAKRNSEKKILRIGSFDIINILSVSFGTYVTTTKTGRAEFQK